jgi:hypothetical protein
VTGVVDSLVTDLANLLNGDLLGLGDLLDSGPLNLGDLTGLTLADGLAGLLGSPDGETSGEPAASSLLGGLAAALITDDNLLSAPDILSAGDVIDFPARALAPVDDLFAQGRHTDYNIALHDNAQSDTGAAATTPSDTANALLGTLLSQNDQAPADAAAGDLLPLDEFMTRLAL